MAPKKGGLGRGLDSLFASAQAAPAKAEKKKLENNVKEPEQKTEQGIIKISIDDIKPNAWQARKDFDEESLSELADSIKENGLLQPITVRKSKKGYEIVSGERRWRATRKAGLKEIDAIVKDYTDEQMSIYMLIENMQREDLNPLEEAEGIDRLMTEYGGTQEEIAKAVGKSRSHIANSLRLLKLPDEVKAYIAGGQLSAGPAKANAGLATKELQQEAAEKAVKEGWSVRKIESYTGAKKARPARKAKAKSLPGFKEAEETMTQNLGTKVRINGSEKKGKLEIDYYSKEELDRIVELLSSLIY